MLSRPQWLGLRIISTGGSLVKDAAAFHTQALLTLPFQFQYSRGLHSALFSFIGAMGFLASAVLPADAYLVSIWRRRSSRPARRKPQAGPEILTASSAPIRLSYRGDQRRICLHPTPAGLALRQYPIHRGDGTRNRSECLLRSARPDRRRVDLQIQRGQERLSDRALDERGVASGGLCRVHRAAAVLWMEEQAHCRRREVCVLAVGELEPG